MVRWMTTCGVLLTFLAIGCGDAVRAPAAPPTAAVAGSASAAPVAATPGAELFPLRTGVLDPVRHQQALCATVMGRLVRGDQELLRVRLGWTPE